MESDCHGTICIFVPNPGGEREFTQSYLLERAKRYDWDGPSVLGEGEPRPFHIVVANV